MLSSLQRGLELTHSGLAPRPVGLSRQAAELSAEFGGTLD